MKPASTIALLLALTMAAGAPQAGKPADPFSGQFGHDGSQPAYEPVWAVVPSGEGWLAGNVVDGDLRPAYRMSASGRDAFWHRMGWPLASASAADCISWGEAPRGLMDLLGDAPPVAAPDTFGLALICHVPAASRQAIDWLADAPHDWFVYDPVAGVMVVRRLPADPP